MSSYSVSPAKPSASMGDPNSHLRSEFLGIPIWEYTMSQFVDWVIERAQGTTSSTAYAINAYSVNTAHRNLQYWRALQRADLVYCDGISVYWGCKLLGRPIPQKLTTTDCLAPIAHRCVSAGLSMYILGNQPGTAALAAKRLVEQHPGLSISGTHSGFFDADQEKRLLVELQRLKPDILWVGMGNPVQELWVEKNKSQLEVPVILTCGGMMEIVSGQLKRPPQWITDNGFEWLYRLVNQPRHTWKRYLLGNVVFMWRLLKHACRKEPGSLPA